MTRREKLFLIMNKERIGLWFERVYGNILSLYDGKF